MDGVAQRFDFDRDEYIERDPTERSWAETPYGLSERWRKRLKSQVLSLKLADKEPLKSLQPLKSATRTNSSGLSNTTRRTFLPSTQTPSPPNLIRTPVIFRQDALKILILICVLVWKVSARSFRTKTNTSRLSALYPLALQTNRRLKGAELIIGVGQGDEGPMTDVIGWRLDDVVDLVRGKKGTVVRLDVIPAAGRADEVRRLVITRNEVRLEEQAAQSKIIEINDLEGSPRKIGVIDVPAFYLDFDAYRRGDPDFRSTTRDVAKLVEELDAPESMVW